MIDSVTLRLSETVSWIELNANINDLGASIRTSLFQPPFMSLPSEARLIHLLDQPHQVWAAVEHVCLARRKALEQYGINVKPTTPDLTQGRLLVTTIDTDRCGEAAILSDGFYDLNDLPGWDTWFCFSSTPAPFGAIFCWVPNRLVETASSGMLGIPAESVKWASNSTILRLTRTTNPVDPTSS